MQKTLVIAAAIAWVTLWAGQAISAAPSARPPVIDTPKVLPAGYIDTSSIDSIVQGLFKSRTGMTDEQKVINFYHWYRRLVYPYRYMAPDRRDVLKSINTAGFLLCGSQAAVAMAILRAAGYPCRPVHITVSTNEEWGHSVWEVYYDDKWHLFDAMSAFYVMTRDHPPHVASIAELAADPTLITKAVRERRCGPEFCYTARDHEMTLEQRQEFARGEPTVAQEDAAWSLLTTKGGSMVDFWTAAATVGKITGRDVKDTLGAKITPGVLDIQLKANERYVRQWQGSGKWITAPSYVRHCPQNMAAGDNEKYDTVNFKYFEPYRQVNLNPFNKAIYRTYGNGYLEWMPRTTEQLAQGLSRMENFTPAPSPVPGAGEKNRGEGIPVFQVTDGGKRACLVLPVKSPYAVVEIELMLDVKLPPGGVVSVTLTPILDGKPGTPRKVWTSDAARDVNPKGKEKPAAKDDPAAPASTKIVIPLMNKPEPIYAYELKIEVTRFANGLLGVRRLKTTFQLNPMSLPGLEPGRNRIRVTVAKPVKLAGWKLFVKYSWSSAPQWKDVRSHRRGLTELPGSYDIDLPPGEKLPKMRSLELFLTED
jgi:hypothetical protein